MRTIWTIIGVIVLIIILVAVYRKLSIRRENFVSMPINNVTPLKNISENTTQREVITEKVIVQPVFIRTSSDCNKQSYQDAVIALYDVYKQKRVIYNNGINTNDPNTIQYHKDMNVAYNAYYNEARKCNYFLG